MWNESISKMNENAWFLERNPVELARMIKLQWFCAVEAWQEVHIIIFYKYMRFELFKRINELRSFVAHSKFEASKELMRLTGWMDVISRIWRFSAEDCNFMMLLSGYHTTRKGIYYKNCFGVAQCTYWLLAILLLFFLVSCGINHL